MNPDTVTWVLTPADLDFLVEAVGVGHEVVMDLETTGLDEYAVLNGLSNGGYPARIVLASFTIPETRDDEEPTTWVLPLSHPESPFRGTWREAFRSVVAGIRDNGTPLVNQNVKFDCRWTYAHTGVDLSRNIVWDTQVSSHLLDENESTRLKERAPATFGIERWDEHDLSTPGAAERVPMFELGIYAAQDTYWTWRLARLHRETMLEQWDVHPPVSPDEVEQAKLGELMRLVSVPTVITLTTIEQGGIGLNVGLAEKMLAEQEELIESLGNELADRYEMDKSDMSWASTSKWFRTWTDRAVEAGDLVVSSMTKRGNPQWSKAVLKRLARRNFVTAEQLLDLRSAVKKAEYLRSWLQKVAPDGRIHATYNVGSVVTGRLSSKEPNMQQVTKALRPCFLPRPGHVIIDLDYSQIEMRVAAFLSRCEPMMAAFRDGQDTHRMMAARVTGKPLEEITPVERQAGKSANFGLLFVMSPEGFREYAESAYGVLFTEEEALDVHTAYFDLWEGLREWHATYMRRAKATGQVSSPIGRIRRLPNINSGNEFLRSEAERRAVNSPVQGFASDIMQIASGLIMGLYPGFPAVEGATLLGTVHDSTLVEAPADDWERVRDECQEHMERSVLTVLRELGCQFDVPLVVDSNVGTAWGLSDVL